MLFPIPNIQESALNEITAPHGLSLSPAQTASLQRQEAQALCRTGRICFGSSILPCLAAAFAGSPHIQQSDWADMLGELTALFYALKQESADTLSDEELIARMARLFDGPAQGSPELLADFFFMPDEPEEDNDDEA